MDVDSVASPRMLLAFLLRLSLSRLMMCLMILPVIDRPQRMPANGNIIPSITSPLICNYTDVRAEMAPAIVLPLPFPPPLVLRHGQADTPRSLL